MNPNNVNEKMKIYLGVGFIVGCLLTFLLMLNFYHPPKEVIKTETITKEVEVSRKDTSTKACINAGGVPTYSAWDGNLNGCIYVGQSSKDSNVELKK